MTELDQATKTEADAGQHAVVLRFHPLWWMNPIWIVIVLMPVLIAYAYVTGPRQYALWRVPKFLDVDAATTIFLGLLALAIGMAVAGLVRPRRLPTELAISVRYIRRLRKLSNVSFTLLLFSYAIWSLLAVRGGLTGADIQAVMGFERGAVSAIKDRAAPVGGLTSFTQLGPVIVVLEIILLRAKMRSNRSVIYMILALATTRALFYGERLALIEVLIPLCIASFALPSIERSMTRRKLANVAPIAALPMLWGIFAVFEYGRSWAAYRRSFNGSYAEFVTQRLTGYYATSINNSALFLREHPRLSDPLYSFASIWDAPVASSLLGTPTAGAFGVRTWWRYTLTAEANPEFNNPGTFGVTAAELGVVGMIAYWLLVGACLMLAYRAFRQGSVFGVILLPVLYVGLVELPRIIYWAQGRFTAAVLLLFVVFLLHGTEQKALRVDSGGASTRVGKMKSEG